MSGQIMVSLTVIGLAGVGYLVFLAWYDGWPRRPLTVTEVSAFIAKMKAQREANGRADDVTLERFRAFGACDDGREFYMVNLIRNRKTLGPTEGARAGDGIAAAHREYLRAWSKPAVPRASHPIFRGVPPVKLFGISDPQPWDSIALMRYRSRRDLFSIVTDDVFAKEAALKGVAIEYTDVYPTPVGFMAAPPRLYVLVGVMLLASSVLLAVVLVGGAW